MLKLRRYTFSLNNDTIDMITKSYGEFEKDDEDDNIAVVFFLGAKVHRYYTEQGKYDE